MAGEIALERLQRAGTVRVAAQGRRFANHYDLAAHLLSALGTLADADTLKSGLGRVDLLFDLLVRIGTPTPEAVGRYLESIHSDLERRPIAEQVVDQILSEDPNRYRLFEELRAARPDADGPPGTAEPIASDFHRAVGEFMSAVGRDGAHDSTKGRRSWRPCFPACSDLTTARLSLEARRRHQNAVRSSPSPSKHGRPWARYAGSRGPPRGRASKSGILLQS